MTQHETTDWPKVGETYLLEYQIHKGSHYRRDDINRTSAASMGFCVLAVVSGYFAKAPESGIEDLFFQSFLAFRGYNHAEHYIQVYPDGYQPQPVRSNFGDKKCEIPTIYKFALGYVIGRGRMNGGLFVEDHTFGEPFTKDGYIKPYVISVIDLSHFTVQDYTTWETTTRAERHRASLEALGRLRL